MVAKEKPIKIRFLFYLPIPNEVKKLLNQKPVSVSVDLDCPIKLLTFSFFIQWNEFSIMGVSNKMEEKVKGVMRFAEELYVYSILQKKFLNNSDSLKQQNVKSGDLLVATLEKNSADLVDFIKNDIDFLANEVRSGE